MKTSLELGRLKLFFFVIVLVAASGARFAHADLYDDDLISETENILNSDQIDVDGQFRKKQTAADRLSKMRKKVEQKHEMMVQKKIEDIRLQEELKLGQKLQSAFSGNLENTDSVNTDQAATVKPQVIVAPAPVVEVKKEKSNRLIPSFGVLNIDGEKIDFESQVNVGLSFESKINDRVLVGLSLGYTSVSIKDINPNYNNFNSTSFYTPGAFYPVNGPGLNQGRDMSYKQFDLSIKGKFYIIKSSKIKPFLGIGAGYRRATLKYSESDPFFNRSFAGRVNLEEAEYAGNYVTAEASLGADVDFSETIGARVEVTYLKGLTESSKAKSFGMNSFSQSLDQSNLDNLGRSIELANNIGISAGLIISF